VVAVTGTHCRLKHPGWRMPLRLVSGNLWNHPRTSLVSGNLWNHPRTALFLETSGTTLEPALFLETSGTTLDALKAISGAVTTCTFLLDQLPPDANNLAVYLDKSLVPEDRGNGWSFGASEQAIVLNGSFCATVRSGPPSLVQALFGCSGGGTPPPTLP
jgi:hypothetical protein